MSKPLLAFYGHHKGGTVWCSKVLIEVCQRLGLRGDYLHSPNQFRFDLQKHVDQNKLDYICYANADAQYLQGIDHLGFHVIRDPRDTVVSGYFSHRNSHPTIGWPELVGHRDRLQSLSKEEGLIAEIDFSATLPTNGIQLNHFEALASWPYRDKRVLELRFEDLTRHPQTHFERIFSFMGLFPNESVSGPSALSLAQLKGILEEISFEKMSKGRQPGEENPASHYRKGQAGDWKNHFTQKVSDAFKAKHGSLLVRLGYELNDNW